LAYIETYVETDWAPIIEGCLAKSSAAQEKLYKTLYPKMMGMVRRYIDRDKYQLAEEILNNGFLKVFQKLESYKFEGSFEGWVRKVIFHCLSDYIRSNIKYMNQTVFIEKDTSISEDVSDKLQYDQLVKMIQTLPATSRAVFNMFAIEGYSHKEIAETLGINEGTSKWHLFEARKILKLKIEQFI
jgi:RNA polymerase sigma factor (sigma-70 family)